MSGAGDQLSPVRFTFEYEGHGWAHASIADGDVTYEVDPSYVLGDPLFGLLQAVVELLRNGDGHAGCEWWYEPALDRWHLLREGDMLHITIRGRWDGTPSSSVLTPSWFWSSAAGGEVRFSTTCDLWAFAKQIRHAVRHLAPVGDDNRDNPRWVKRTAEYRALCQLLDEHKLAVGQISGRPNRP